MTGSRAAAGCFTSRRAACSAVPKKQNCCTVLSKLNNLARRAIRSNRSQVSPFGYSVIDCPDGTVS
jgi:hypothetical protein